MRVSLIAAMAENRAIGIRNGLPWRIPEDLKRFRAITSGHPVIMGRKTFESIGRPLPNRRNIVITRQKDYRAEGVEVTDSLEKAIQLGVGDKDEVFVIGGAEIYALALPRADRIHLTLVHQAVEGDAFFPVWDSADFNEVSREDSSPQAEPRYSFIVLDRAY